MKFDRYVFGTFLWAIIGCFYLIVGDQYLFGAVAFLSATLWQIAGKVVNDLKSE